METPGSRQDDPVWMADRLEAWARAHVDTAARVERLERLPGHSSVSWGFDVTRPQDGRERLVLRVVPEGVPRRGSTDVLRQVPILRAVQRAGVPAPRVRDAGESIAFFGVAYLIVDRVPGSTLGDVFAPDGAPAPAHDPERLYGQAIDALAAIHAADTAGVPEEAPPTLDDEIARWQPLLDKAGRSEWTAYGVALQGALNATRPQQAPIGLVHGDFYPNNWMFDGARLSAVLDWETAGLGPQLLDLGWLCMMLDRASWAAHRRPDLAWSPGPEFVAARYPREVPELSWYRALAGYRMAALTGHYLSLHERGRRPDPVWPAIAESVDALLGRAAELLQSVPTPSP